MDGRSGKENFSLIPTGVKYPDHNADGNGFAQDVGEHLIG